MEFPIKSSPLPDSGDPWPGLRLSRSGAEEVFLVARCPDGADARPAAGALFRAMASALSDAGMAVVHERIFGSLSAASPILDERRRAFLDRGLDPDAPVTYIEGHPPWGAGLAGVIVHAVSASPDAPVWTIRDGAVPCGRGWKRHGATFLSLQNIHGLEHGPAAINTPPVQTRRLIERVEKVLESHGASFRDVVRTWFYLSRILDWYDDFNQVRNEKYRQFRILPGPGSDRLLLPASTGISGDNPHAAAAVLDLIAVLRPEGSGVSVRQMSNPRQKDAVTYGSAFSRGATLCCPAGSTLQVSGTAAIDEKGRSLYPGDVRSQIACTLDHVEALLEQEGAGLRDIAAATVFVKRPEDAAAFRSLILRRGLEALPYVLVVADVCRPELLFEIDAELVLRSDPPPG